MKDHLLWTSSVVRTIVECLQLIAGLFRIVHALKQRINTGIIFAPEIVRDYEFWSVKGVCSRQDHQQDSETVGASDTVPGIVPSLRGWPRDRGRTLKPTVEDAVLSEDHSGGCKNVNFRIARNARLTASKLKSEQVKTR